MRFAVVADLPGAGRVGQTRSLRPVALLDLGADHHARVQIYTILQPSGFGFLLLMKPMLGKPPVLLVWGRQLIIDSSSVMYSPSGMPRPG